MAGGNPVPQDRVSRLALICPAVIPAEDDGDGVKKGRWLRVAFFAVSHGLFFAD
jgi:hypothetical protein